jgi:pilus assembly protein CpaC
LGDLPVLGPLFRSTQFQKNESELVIIVTPYLVRPVSGRIPGPTDGYIAPHDSDIYWTGKTGRQSEASAVSAPVGANGNGLIGPAGFIVN